MGGEKRGSKSGGFLHLFDWNRKSRKKLFSGGSSLPEKTEKGKRACESVVHSQLGLVYEDEIPGAVSVKGSSDYSCASSVIDEEGYTMKAPSVVARLMGLDSFPASDVSEPYIAPLFDSKSLSGNHSKKRSPSSYMNEQHGGPVKPVNLRMPKMPSSPIERFQTEMLPPRSAKSIPITHHKLLSPVKNPGFISPKNATHIMEAAVKILEPGLQNSISRSRNPLFGTPSVPLKLRDMKDVPLAPHRTSKLPETSRRLVESNTLRSLKGQSLNKSWNSDDTATSKSSLDAEEYNPGCSKSKAKSVSLAVQAKVNVQRREGVTAGNRNAGSCKIREQCEVGQQFKSRSHTERNRQQRKSSTTSQFSVLQQNNLKQNCITTRDKLVKNKSSRDAASAKNKGVNNAQGSSKVGYRKGDLLPADFNGDGLMSCMSNYPRKKRLIERESFSSNGSLVDNKHAAGPEILLRQNVVIGEYSKWLDDNGTNGSDIVSFTFTSPLVKPISGSKLSSRGSWDERKGYCSGTMGENSTVGSDNKEKPSFRSNVIGGDELSLLLGQKLKELVSRANLSYCDLVSSSSTSTTVHEPGWSDHVPASEPIQTNTEFHSHCFTDERSCISDCATSLTIDQALSTRNSLQEAEQAKTSYSIGAAKVNHQPSPLSILDAPFSNESCNSSESCESNGSKICSSSVQAQQISVLEPINSVIPAETEFDFVDSASSSFMETIYDENVHTKEPEQDLEYVKEILSKTGSIFERTCKNIKPLTFDVFENEMETEGASSRTKRKILFDCVNECLDKKFSRYFLARYRSWSKGATMTTNELAEEFYNEQVKWKSMGGLSTDELVDKDLSSRLGRWVDFEIEAFEVGAEVERDIFDYLVDEIVCDILSKGLQ